MKGCKGFSKGLVCRGKQYKENTTFEEDKAKICESGMHFCKNPLDVLDYYPIIDDNGELNEFAEVEALDKCLTDDDKKYTTKKLKIGCKLSLGEFVKASIEFLKENTSGDSSQVATSGYCSQVASSGDGSKIASSGDGSKIASSGYCSQVATSGEDSVIANIGNNGKAKAVKGCWITLAEYKDGKPVCVKTEYVDGKKIKENIWYMLKNGEFKEV